MSYPSTDYTHLGRWVSQVPRYCAHPGNPHPLIERRMTSGWVECSCGGHRTVRCLYYAEDGFCGAVHYLPALTAACSLSGIPAQRHSTAT